MRASCLLLIGWLALAAAPAVSAAPADEAMLDDGDGLKPTLPRLQGRVRLGMSASTLDLSGPAGPAADGRLSGASVLGDPRSYGRHTCTVTMEAGAVKTAEYSFAD